MVSNTDRLALSPAEVAATLGISLNAAYSLIREKRIPAVRLGRRWVVPRRELEAMLSENCDKEG